MFAFAITFLLIFGTNLPSGIYSSLYPGVETIITVRGWSFLVENFRSYVLNNALAGMKLEDHTEVDGDSTYIFSNMRVSEITESPVVEVSSAEGQIKIQLNRINAVMRGHWKYERNNWIHLTDEGDLTATVTGADVALTVFVERDWQTSMDCRAISANVDVRFSGRSGWLYTLLQRFWRSKTVREVHEMLCHKSKGLVKDYIEILWAKYGVRQELFFYDQLIYDLSIVGLLEVNSSYVRVKHYGTVSWTDAEEQFPFLAHQFPEPSIWINSEIVENPAKPMVIFSFSSHILNTLLFSAFKNNLLAYYLTERDLSLTKRDLLKVRCASDQCIGSLLQEPVRQIHENSTVEIFLKTHSAPSAKIEANGILLFFEGSMAVHLRRPNGMSEYLFRVLVDAYYLVQVTLLPDALRAEKVRLSQFSVRHLQSGASGIELTQTEMDLLFRGLNHIFIEEKLKEIGSISLPLPVKGPLSDSSLSLKKDVLRVQGVVDSV